jgi:hypothetical protein
VSDLRDYTPAPELKSESESGVSQVKRVGAAAGVLSSSSLESTMRIFLLLLSVVTFAAVAVGQKDRPTTPAPSDDFSGMYTFLADGEFVQLNLEDGGKVTGYVSRYGTLESDRGAFLDQFFKSGTLNGQHIEWVTEPVHGVWYDFKGTIGRGNGKTPDNEGYYTMHGTLTEHSTDAARKETARQREVVLKSFPEGLGDEKDKRD